MKERLIELLQEYTDDNNGGGSNHGRADYLLANGVVVEVCRCKDCVYWDGGGYDGRCEAPKNGLIRDYTNYDDFCSYGERKEK